MYKSETLVWKEKYGLRIKLIQTDDLRAMIVVEN